MDDEMGKKDGGITASIDRILTIELVRVVERAAVSAARFRGRGDDVEADRAAVDAMRRELNHIPIDGTVVIGEGEEGAAPMLHVGESVGTKAGPKLDVALVSLEGATICAKSLPNALSVVAVAPAGGFLQVPEVYMDKIAIGRGYPDGLVDLDAAPHENIAAVAKAKGVPVERITACILDRPRNGRLIGEVRETGAAIRLISDGDVTGIIHTTDPDETGIDIYMGVGGAPEGVLAAAALRCIGGQMQGRLIINPDQRERARRLGIKDFDRKYTIKDMVTDDIYFAATGVTDGNFLQGVHFGADAITTHSVVMRSSTGTVRWIKARHSELGKFHLN